MRRSRAKTYPIPPNQSVYLEEVCSMAVRGPSRGPTYKVVLLGELGVGKTSLFRRLKDNTFDEYQTATTGIDSCTKVIKIDGDNVMVSDN